MRRKTSRVRGNYKEGEGKHQEKQKGHFWIGIKKRLENTIQNTEE